MKRVKILFVAIALLTAGWPASVEAKDCSLKARTESTGVGTTYDPFSPVGTVLDLELTVANDGADSCQARFYVAPVDGALRLSAGANQLLFRIEGSSGGGQSGIGKYGPFYATVPGFGSTSVRMQFTILPQQVVARDDYIADLVLSGEADDGSAINISGENAQLRVRVPSRVEMSISGAASHSLGHGMAPASIDFEGAKTGQSGRVFVNVWSNGPVAITLDSENNGLLRLIGNENLTPISYSATFDGQSMTLAAPYVVERLPPASIAGASYELAVTLGKVESNFAGLYKDVINVNVTEN